MRKKPRPSLVIDLVFASLLVTLFCKSTRSEPQPVLAGVVTSESNGPMEGVLVKAKQMGGNITVTVVTDDHGRYVFPAGRLAPGRYSLTIRAIGYDLANSATSVTVGKKTTNADLKLSKVDALATAAQLQPAEWLMSIPGMPSQKNAIYGCAGTCHNLNLPLKSTYDPSGWMTTLVRMRNWEPASNVDNPILLPYHSGQRPEDEKFAQYLASINLSSRTTLDFEWKTYPRPTGKASRVFITEYDLPRLNAEPHDVVMDSEGMIWYIDFAEAFLGRLDPHTGKTKEWTLTEFKPGFAPGSLGLALDQQENLWIARSFQGGIAKFDRKTEKITNYSIPAENNNVHSRTSFIAVGPDGKVWFDDTFNRRMYIVNPTTGQMKGYSLYPGFKWDLENDPGASQGNGENHFPYGVAVSSTGIGYWADLGNRNIGELDPETGKTTLYPTPTPASAPRRMNMGAEDQLWFAENNLSSRKIAMFDTKTKQFKEWTDPLVWDTPYDVVCDKAGYAWTGGIPTDYVSRLNPKTGEIVQYLLPSLAVNIRRVSVDNFTSPPSMLIGENHQAKIALIQPLE